MKNKNALLITIILVLTSSSVILVYRSFNEQPPVIVVPEISQEVAHIRQQIDAVDRRIKASMQRLDSGGDLDKLINSRQFQELVSDSLQPVVVTESGRDNPFVPVNRGGGQPQEDFTSP